MPRTAAELRGEWALVDFLNHGSFGACPRAVLESQRQWRDRMEAEPVRFFVRELADEMEVARARAAEFVGARPENFAFVRNATEGVNAVLRSLEWSADDEILVLDHGYNACSNAARYVAERAGGRVVVAELPFPIEDPEQAVAMILAACTPNTRLALIDHITSPTALVLPIAKIVRSLEALGIDTLVDGAHGPGMLKLDLEGLEAAYYTGNFHKWCCAPKGAAMLWVRPDRQEGLHPAVISHGYNSPRDRARWLEEFDWVGTDDPSPFLALPAALDHIGGLLPGGWDAVRQHTRDLALEGRSIIASALGSAPSCPDSMIGSIASIPLPPGEAEAPLSAFYVDPLHIQLFEEHRIEVPVAPFPAPPERIIRISAHLYNERAQYERLAKALAKLLG